MNEETKYFNAIFYKEISDKMSVININLKKFKEFIKNNPDCLKESKTGDKFLNLKVVKKKEAGKYGDTHFIALNDYEKKEYEKEEYEVTEQSNDDDLPF